MELIRFCDLDGTLIHSYREAIKNGVLVECYNGKPLSYMDKLVYDKLQSISKDSFIPVTSRTKEQYRRISFYKSGECPKYALLDNGGVLLINGEEDIQWTKEMKAYLSDDLAKYDEIIEHISRFGETKLQDELVIFNKPVSDVDRDLLEKYISQYDCMQMFQHRSKIYICSCKLTKGYAVKKFMDRFGIRYAIAAGDSQVDVTMIDQVLHGFFALELLNIIDKKYLTKSSFIEKLDLANFMLNYEMKE